MSSVTLTKHQSFESLNMAIKKPPLLRLTRHSISKNQSDNQYKLGSLTDRSQLPQNINQMSFRNNTYYKRNFYHHTSIFRMQEYKDLTNQYFNLADSKAQDLPSVKLDGSQRKVFIQDFRRRVTEYLITSRYKKEYASKAFRKYYKDMKNRNGVESSLQSSFSGPHSQIKWENPGESQAENQLSLNRFDNIGFVVKVKNGKSIHRKKIDGRSIQNRLLKHLEPFLREDNMDYDTKLYYSMMQLENIVDKLEREAYHVLLPENIQENPSDYNDYYKFDPSRKQFYFESFIDDRIVDQIVNEVAISVDDFFSRPETPILIIEEPHEEHKIAFNPEPKLPETEYEDEYDDDGNPTGVQVKKGQTAQKPKEKTESKPQFVYQPKIETNPPELPSPKKKSQQNQQNELERQEKLRKQKEAEKLRQEERDRVRQERRAEMDRIEKELQDKKNQRDPDFIYKRQMEQDPQLKRKVDLQSTPSVKDGGKSPKKKGRPTAQIQNTDQSDQASLQSRTVQTQQTEQSQRQITAAQLPAQLPAIRLQTKSDRNTEQTPSRNVLVNPSIPIPTISDTLSPRAKLLSLESPKAETIVTMRSEQFVGSQKTIATSPSVRMKREEVLRMKEDITNRLAQIEDTLTKKNHNFYDILLEADNIFDVDINEYKLCHKDPEQVEVPNIDREDERRIYKDIYSWREEVLVEIPILRDVNKNAQDAIQEEGTSESDSEDDKKSKKKKMRKNSDSD